jgi:hypothetical protein
MVGKKRGRRPLVKGRDANVLVQAQTTVSTANTAFPTFQHEAEPAPSSGRGYPPARSVAAMVAASDEHSEEPDPPVQVLFGTYVGEQRHVTPRAMKMSANMDAGSHQRRWVERRPCNRDSSARARMLNLSSGEAADADADADADASSKSRKFEAPCPLSGLLHAHCPTGWRACQRPFVFRQNWWLGLG